MSRFRALLPFVLGLIAGSTDTIGFLGLNGLFTAHITGNLVVLASRVIAGNGAVLSHVLAVPMFGLASLLAALFARHLEDAGSGTVRPLLALELSLLVMFFVLAVFCRTRFDIDSPIGVAIGMCGVAAMAVQAVVDKSALLSTAPTGVITTNAIMLVIALSQLVDARESLEKKEAQRQLQRLLPATTGFLLGCAAGALSEAAWSLWSLWIPVLLAVLVNVLCLVEATSTNSELRLDHRAMAPTESSRQNLNRRRLR